MHDGSSVRSVFGQDHRRVKVDTRCEHLHGHAFRVRARDVLDVDCEPICEELTRRRVKVSCAPLKRELDSCNRLQRAPGGNWRRGGRK